MLESLFESAVGSDWTNSEGWRDGPVLTGWHGVTVDSVGRVTALDLSRNGLSGRLPGNLGQLAHMVPVCSTRLRGGFGGSRVVTSRLA